MFLPAQHPSAVAPAVRLPLVAHKYEIPVR
jgi:hypothetical protein